MLPYSCADCEHSNETGKYYDTCDHPEQDMDEQGHGPVIGDISEVEEDCPLRTKKEQR